MSDAPLRSIIASAYTIPLKIPEQDGTLTWDSVEVVVVRLDDGDAEGIGYAYGPKCAAELVVDKLAEPLHSLTACSNGLAHRRMHAAV
ncbi:MAG: hypothetical protein KDD44_12440, partial [Bdellovibrionales bacterium]|nr:hypothetical protein [Bdellovibrionales bacterium]